MRDAFHLLMGPHMTKCLAERGHALGEQVMKRPCVCGHRFDGHAIEWEDVASPEFPHAKRPHGKACGVEGCGCAAFERREA